MKTRRANSFILFIKKILKLIKFIIIISLCGLFIYGLWKYLTESGTFKIKDIEVEGVKTLKREDVISASGLKLDENIFSVNLKKTKKCLKIIRQIDTIEITKKYPDAVSIRISERDPVAQVETGKKNKEIELVDINGFIFPGKAAGLPKIVKTTDEDILRLIVRFISKLKETDTEFYGKLSTISGSCPDDIRFKAYGVDIRWALSGNDFKDKLKDLKKVIKDIKEKQKECSFIDTRFWQINKRDIIVK